MDGETREEEQNADLLKRMSVIHERLMTATKRAYPDLKAKTRTDVFDQILQHMTALLAIGSMCEDKGPPSHTHTAIAIVNGCFRNNSSLEDVHTGVLELDDENMKTLTMEMTARVSDWLVCAEALSVDEELLRMFIRGSMMGAHDWEDDRSKLPFNKLVIS